MGANDTLDGKDDHVSREAYRQVEPSLTSAFVSNFSTRASIWPIKSTIVIIHCVDNDLYFSFIIHIVERSAYSELEKK